MLHDSDFKSIWDLAHIWEGYDPAKTDPTNLPGPVADKIMKIIWGYIRKKLVIRRRAGGLVPNEAFFLFFIDVNRWRVRLMKIAQTQKFDREYLSSLFLMRSQVLKWCTEEYIDPPEIWKPAGIQGHAPLGVAAAASARHKEEELHKQLCQAIARTLWDIDPRIPPAHLAKQRAVRLYGNGQLYKDEETVRDWIAEVDPRRKERKTGRPPTIEYRIDLETGGLNKKVVRGDNETP